MLTSLTLIFISGLSASWICKKIKLPELIGMIIVGIIIGPYALDYLDDKILLISPDLRQIALIVILSRAGLNLCLKDFKGVGRTTSLLCFLPALLEIIGTCYLAPKFFSMTYIEAFLLGCTIAAVSPAIIIPRMLAIKEKGYGAKNNIPDIVTLCSSLDDIIVIILFSTALTYVETGVFNYSMVYTFPLSILFGIFIGCIVSIVYCFYLRLFSPKDSHSLIVLLSIYFLLLKCEDLLSGYIPFSALLAILSSTIFMNHYTPKLSQRLSESFEKLWDCSQIWLFVLVGASLNISSIKSIIIPSIVLITLCQVFRFSGVFLSLIDSEFNQKEKLFFSFSYIPKATVQAAIGSIPLNLGLPCGELILGISIISILYTAPIGAILIDKYYDKLLRRM